MKDIKVIPQRFVSIRWKFLTVFMFLIIVPTVLLGISVYQTYREEALHNQENDLRLIASGWRQTADVYYQQLQRFWKREDVLVQKRLLSIAQSSREVALHSSHEDQDHTKEKILKILAERKIDRQGYLLILSHSGEFLVYRHQLVGKDPVLLKHVQQVSENFRDIIQKAVSLRADEYHVVHYDQQDTLRVVPRKKMAVFVNVPQLQWIIAAVTYHEDYKSIDLERTMQDELRQSMGDFDIGKRGYLWIIDGQGRYVLSHDHLRDGEDLVSDGSQSVRDFVRELVEQAITLKPSETFIKRYGWRNIHEPRELPKIAAVAYHAGWGWLIGASSYEEDFLKGLQVIRWQIITICATFILLGSVLAFFFASRVSRPIRKLERIALNRDLSTKIGADLLASTDEIGRLANAFSQMMISLNEKISLLEESRKDLLAANQKLLQMQSQLVHSEKMAAIGQLSAGMAHEINNPLAYVSSNVEVLEQYVEQYERVMRFYETLPEILKKCQAEGCPDIILEAEKKISDVRGEALLLPHDEIAQLLRETKDGLQRVKKIILDLRIFSRVDKGEMQSTDLELLLERVITIAGAEIKQVASISKDFFGLPCILCQEQRMGQVFLNLLVNAAHALPKQGGKIILRTRIDGDWVCIDVEDNGHGIPPEDLSTIFEPFFTTKPVGQGTGLGLSISYEIVHQHGGEIRVRSAPGEGSVFSVLLPFRTKSEVTKLPLAGGYHAG